MACSKDFGDKYIPGSDADSEEIFTFPYLIEEETVKYIKSHGRIMFIVRGLPGTGKRTLSKMIANTYNGSDVFSADGYFSATFSSGMRSKESLRESHLYCHKNVLKACEKNVHPIIVCNSHVRKMEMDEYLKFAAKFNYTIIMVDTSHKFVVSPEILAESNAQGLDVSYFQKRIKQWQNILPFFTGWFISLSDSHHILNELLNVLEVLQANETFCTNININEGDLFSYYLAKKLLFCVAGCGSNNFNYDLKRYYSSKMVKEHNGQSFEIPIFSFVFTESDILALVQLDECMKKLIFRHKEKKDAKDNLKVRPSELDLLTQGFGEMKIKGNAKSKEYSKTVPLQKFSISSEPCFTGNVNIKNISIRNCSFIHLAEREANEIFPYKFQESFVLTLKYLRNCDLKTDCDACKAYDIHFLPSGICVAILKKTLVVRSVFTGLYI